MKEEKEETAILELTPEDFSVIMMLDEFINDQYEEEDFVHIDSDELYTEGYEVGIRFKGSESQCRYPKESEEYKHWSIGFSDGRKDRSLNNCKIKNITHPDFDY